jgi:NitT/TauT family transport system substrate-binding protein
MMTFISFLCTSAFFLSWPSISWSKSLNQPTKAATARRDNPLRVALNWKAEPQFGGFYQALLNQDVPLELIEGGSGTPTVQMLTFKKIDYAIVSAEEILISNDRNPQNPLVALFAAFQTNPQVLMTLESRGVKNISDLLSRKGVVSAQIGLTYVAFLKKKYPQSPVQWVPYLGGITGLLQQKDYAQQGFLSSEPLLAQSQGLSISSFLVADEGFNPYTTVLAARRSDLESKPDEVRRLVSAVRKGWQDYIKNPQAANSAMAKLNSSMSQESFGKSAAAQKPLLGAGNGQMELRRWQELIQALQDLKIVKGKLKAEDQFVNFQ